jgi:POT family proton-dependent oligopeptide transporter
LGTTTEADAAVPQRGFFGHPGGLSTLFFTETWERFSYYGMRAILLYYMYEQATAGGLGIDKGLAKSLVAVYGAALYMSPIVGGWVADRMIGSRNAIFWGGVLIMVAHIALTIPVGAPALYASMILLVLGTGLLKSNITAAVGDLYSADDPRRDAGFSLFYMGINLGAFLAPLVVGTLGQKVNYHVGFGVAAIGMAIGLTQYWIRRRNLGTAGLRPTNPMTDGERGRVFARLAIGLVLLVAAVVVLAVFGLLSAELVVNAISALSFLVPVAYFVVMFTSKKVSSVERSRLVAYIPLFIGALLFWFVEEQQTTVWAQFADTQTNLDVAGFHIPSSWAQSVNPIVIIVFAPLLAFVWTKRGDRQSGTPRKFSAGLLLTGAGFLIMVIPCLLDGPDGKSNPLWLVASLTVMTLGEVCLSPVGLSATTKLAPAAFVAQTVGLFYASDAAGQGLIAEIAPLYDAHSAPVYFGSIGGIVFVAGIVLYVIAPAIQRKMLGVR